MLKAQKIMSHMGIATPDRSMPMPAVIMMASMKMDMNFWPSWAPWRNDSAQAQMSCSTMHTLLPRWRLTREKRNSMILVVTMPRMKPPTSENTMP